VVAAAAAAAANFSFAGMVCYSDRQRSADAAAAAVSPASKPEQPHSQHEDQDDEAAPETEGGLTRLEAALAAEAEAAAAAAGDAPPAAAAAAAVDANNLRKVALKFRPQFRLPPLLTVLRAARRYEPDFDAGSVRIYNGKHAAVVAALVGVWLCLQCSQFCGQPTLLPTLMFAGWLAVLMWRLHIFVGAVVACCGIAFRTAI
jgi:hypothetical protein